MRRLLSISLLLVLAVALLLWAALDLCPNRNNHHAGDEMHHGNCADGMMDDQQNADQTPYEMSGSYASLSYQAPACTAVSPAVDDYSTSQNLKAPTLQQLVVLAVLFELAGIDLSSAQTFLPAPDFLNKSGPPLTDSPLRGPPSATPAV